MGINLTFVSLVIFILSNLISQFLYKRVLSDIEGITSLVSNFNSLLTLVLGFVFQVSSVVSWFIVLKHNTMTWSGITLSLLPISMVLMGRFVFGEPLSKQTIVGIIFVTVGLLVVNVPVRK